MNNLLEIKYARKKKKREVNEAFKYLRGICSLINKPTSN